MTTVGSHSGCRATTQAITAQSEMSGTIMTDLQQARALDVDKLMAFVFKAVDEVGATLNTALVVMG